VDEGGRRDKFSAMKVPMQCPLVLLVNVNGIKVKAFGSGASLNNI
jgi:hypothetical protein